MKYLAIIVLSLLHIPATFANTENFIAPEVLQKVVINEFLPNPEGKDAENEWIELKNFNNHTVHLRGAFLDDKNEGSKPFQFTDESIEPLGFFLIRITESKINLNNDKDIVRLLAPNKKLVHSVEYKGDGRENQSYARNENGTYFWTTKLTPHEENIFENPLEISKKPSKSEKKSQQNPFQNGNLSNKIFIMEILPNPEGNDIENEWIELFNADDKDISLGNWKLSDSEGGSKAYIFSDQTRIDATSYLLISRNESHLALNNDTDSVRLFDFQGNMIDEIEYDNAKEGMSYTKNVILSASDDREQGIETPFQKENASWQWTSDLTPGAPNHAYEIIQGTILETFENAFSLKIQKKTLKISYSEIESELLKTLFIPETEIKITAKKNNENTYELKDFEILHQAEWKIETNTLSSKKNLLKIALLIIPFACFFLINRTSVRKPNLKQ